MMLVHHVPFHFITVRWVEDLIEPVLHVLIWQNALLPYQWLFVSLSSSFHSQTGGNLLTYARLFQWYPHWHWSGLRCSIFRMKYFLSGSGCSLACWWGRGSQELVLGGNGRVRSKSPCTQSIPCIGECSLLLRATEVNATKYLHCTS